ncbi:MAG: hypothetical protein ACKO6F_00485 [Cyanobium sp.]
MNANTNQAHLGPAASGAILAATLGLGLPARVLADCLLPEDDTTVRIAVRSCRAIQADSNPEVRAHARLDGPGALVGAATLRRLYTGALITDDQGWRWMAPSQTADPCRGFRPGSTVEERASHTCCDTGRWGKCVFGGRFLSDPGKPLINAFQ